uniref:Uncharacterized protein n=1 Tax=Trichogramma kaykai TaxID=54128 RepID=A0ABD2WD75_9HYME
MDLKTVSTSRLKPTFSTFHDTENPVALARDDNYTQINQYDTQNTDLQDDFDHEEVVSDQKTAERIVSNSTSKQPRKPKVLDNKQSNIVKSKNQKKKSVRFCDDHAYSAAHKTFREY